MKIENIAVGVWVAVDPADREAAKKLAEAALVDAQPIPDEQAGGSQPPADA